MTALQHGVKLKATRKLQNLEFSVKKTTSPYETLVLKIDTIEVTDDTEHCHYRPYYDSQVSVSRCKYSFYFINFFFKFTVHKTLNSTLFFSIQRYR